MILVHTRQWVKSGRHARLPTPTTRKKRSPRKLGKQVRVSGPLSLPKVSRFQAIRADMSHAPYLLAFKANWLQLQPGRALQPCRAQFSRQLDGKGASSAARLQIGLTHACMDETARLWGGSEEGMAGVAGQVRSNSGSDRKNSRSI